MLLGEKVDTALITLHRTISALSVYLLPAANAPTFHTLALSYYVPVFVGLTAQAVTGSHFNSLCSLFLTGHS